MAGSLARRVEALLWGRQLSSLRPPARSLVGLARYVHCLVRDVLSGPLTLYAMGLVYVTILSLVPLLAVSFAVAQALGWHLQLVPLLHRMFGPLGAGADQLTDWVMSFVTNAQGEVVTGVGLLFLLLAALSMADQVERSMDGIWRVERPRRLLRRAGNYLAFILAGPPAMAGALALIATLGEATGLARLSPYALACLGFALVYWSVPNAPVRLRDALAGGIVGGVLWAGSSIAFATLAARSATTFTIYSTFAIAFMALVWLYLCWLTLLVGAQVAFYAGHRQFMQAGYRQPVHGTAHREHMALAVMQLLAAGAGSRGVTDITGQTGIAGQALGPVLDRLEAAGLLMREADDGLRLSRPAADIALRDIVLAVRQPAQSEVGEDLHWPAASRRLMERLDACLGDALAGATLADLAGQRAPGADPARG